MKVTAAECIALMWTLGAVQRTIAMRISPALQSRHGLDLKLFILLKRLQAGMAHPGDLARSGLEPPSRVSRALDKLEALGLVVRALDAEDSRRIRLTLTEPAQRVLAEVDADIAEVMGPALAKLAPEARRQIQSGLEEVLAELQAQQP